MLLGDAGLGTEVETRVRPDPGRLRHSALLHDFLQSGRTLWCRRPAQFGGGLWGLCCGTLRSSAVFRFAGADYPGAAKWIGEHRSSSLAARLLEPH